jgi:Sulfotransferase family
MGGEEAYRRWRLRLTLARFDRACGGAIVSPDQARNEWPIVVGGCHRSGTSLVRRILDAHSRIHCGPEVKFFRDFYGDYFEDPLGPYRYPRTARSLLPEEDLLDVLGRAFVAVHEEAARRADKPRWADKAPENVVYLDEWERLLGDEWLLLQVVRNPLDTLASMDDVGFPLTLPADLAGRAAFYRRYTESGLDFGTRFPDRYVRVVYEELVDAPEAVVRRLMTSLGEELEGQQLVLNAAAHQVGLEDPKIAATTGIHRESIDRWRSHLTSDEADEVWTTTSDLWHLIDPGGRIWAPAAA